MAQFRNPADPRDAAVNARRDVKRIQLKSSGSLDWASVVQVDKNNPDAVDHGPAYNEAYQAWALPEHMREPG